MLFNRLWPDAGEIDAEAAAEALDLAAHAPPERPYVALNMVASLDGRAAVQGTTRELGGEADRAFFHALRRQVDAVMAGGGTVRAERYGKAPGKLVVVTGRLNLPPDLPVLGDPEAELIVATASQDDLGEVAAKVSYERTGDDLPLLLARLRDEHGIRSLLCEGGPTLNAHLLAAGAVDELFLTIAPTLFGGEDPLTIVAGRELPVPAQAQLMTVYEGGGELLTHWKIRCTA